MWIIPRADEHVLAGKFGYRVLGTLWPGGDGRVVEVEQAVLLGKFGGEVRGAPVRVGHVVLPPALG